MAAVTLNGHACSAALLTIPGVGLWYASLDLSDVAELSGEVTLQWLDTTWRGFVVAGAVVDGVSKYRVVAGAGGWGKVLAPRAYANDAGLQVARLIADVAADCGEQIDGAPATRLGPHFNRPRGPASFALNLLTPRAWYARPDGVVAFGARPSLPASALPIVERNPAGRVVELAALDSVAGLEPGTATDYGAAADVELELSAEGLRARLYASAAPSRRLQAFARLLAALDPGARFRGVHEYRVVTQVGERLNLQPVRSRADLPDLQRVPVRAGVPGAKALHMLGSQVLVAFLEGDPTRPCVVGFDAPDQPGWQPIMLQFGGPLALGVARQTDPVIAGPFGGSIVGGSVRVRASL
jgi:hypothetical protein